MHIYSLDFDDLNYNDIQGKLDAIADFKILFPDADENGTFYIMPVIKDTKVIYRAAFLLEADNSLKFLSFIENAKENIETTEQNTNEIKGSNND